MLAFASAICLLAISACEQDPVPPGGEPGESPEIVSETAAEASPPDEAPLIAPPSDQVETTADSGTDDDPIHPLRSVYDYSPREFGLLKDAEINASASVVYYSPELSDRVFSTNPELNEPPADAGYTYTDSSGDPVPSSDTLPIPVISLSDTDTPYPEVSVPPAVDADGNPLLVLFEFDTSPEFHSPNAWRHPALLPAFAVQDRRSPAGMQLRLQTALESTGLETTVRFPFRVTSMRLPEERDGLTPQEMMRQARALGHGLSVDETISEVFDWVRYRYHWGDDVLLHSPYDTFVARAGECGYINQLAGQFLEFNGIRYRSVSGFNPIAREVYPGGGHTAIEVWNADTGRWNYLDSYLNLRMSLPVRRADESPKGDETIYALPPQLHEILGPDLGLSELFRYRTYFDINGRAPAVHMHAIAGEEATYGMGWDLLVAPQSTAEQLFDDEVRIYVRARYIDTDGEALSQVKALDGVFSQSTTTSFVVSPPDLVE